MNQQNRQDQVTAVYLDSTIWQATTADNYIQEVEEAVHLYLATFCPQRPPQHEDIRQTMIGFWCCIKITQNSIYLYIYTCFPHWLLPKIFSCCFTYFSQEPKPELVKSKFVAQLLPSGKRIQLQFIRHILYSPQVRVSHRFDLIYKNILLIYYSQHSFMITIP